MLLPSSPAEPLSPDEGVVDCRVFSSSLQVTDSQIKPKHLTLIVSHGIFSKGTKIFEGIFDEIIVSNSYQSSQEMSPIVKTINLF